MGIKNLFIMGTVQQQTRRLVTVAANFLIKYLTAVVAVVSEVPSGGAY